MTLICAFTGIAKAADFHVGVQDAPTTYQYTYTGTTLTDVVFGSCGRGTPSDDGCVTILNDSGSTLTSLVIDVPVTSETPDTESNPCLSGTGFADCIATLIDNNTEYQFDITGLDVPANGFCTSGDTFEIEETGVDPKDFPGIGVGPMSVTPEPASFWLLATGVLLFGGFLYRRNLGIGALDS